MYIKKEKNSKSKTESTRTESPWQKKNPCFVSRVFFCWMLPLYYKGMQRDLDELDFVPVNRQYKSELVGDLLHRKWLEEQDAATAADRTPSLTKVLIKNFWLDFVPGGIMQFLFQACKTATPMLFAKMLLYWSANSTMSRQTAMAYAASMIAIYWLSVIFNNHGNLACQKFGMKLRIATSSLVYRKLLRTNIASLSDTAVGKVVNILSSDMHIFDFAMLNLNSIWVAPIQMAVVCYLSYLQAGFAALFGLIALVVIAVPAQGILSHSIGVMRLLVAEKTDERVKAISEVIDGIQVIKMYAWELPFIKLLFAKRDEEIKQIKKVSLLKMLLLGFWIFGERMALFVTILTHVLIGNTMSANIIYPLLQLMNVINVNVTLLCPLAMSYTAELRVSLQRVQDLLLLGDQHDLPNSSSKPPPSVLLRKLSAALEKTDDAVKPLSYRSLEHASRLSRSLMLRPSVTQPGIENALELHNVSASWTGEHNNCILKNVSLKIRRGQVCAIVGAVGSGKSSILQLLLKELPAASGSVSVHGNLSYCSQKSWLFSSTVRENIIFGLQYDSEKYKEVCKACCLEEDFKQFPYGDQSLVGERGVSLSGGQRARISLARSIYREADIYLLDDPLSAVDANVGRLLFEGCINGYLRGRTRVLVTHQTQFLKAVDYIIVLNKGIVEYTGTSDEFVCSGKEFSSMLASLLDSKDRGHVELGVITDEKGKTNSVTIPTKNEEFNEYEAQKMQAEDRASGILRLEVVVAYFRSGGNICFFLFTVGMSLLSIASAHASDYWVSYWLNNEDAYVKSLEGVNPDPGLGVQVGLFTTGQYLLIHGLLIVACILIVNMRVLPIVELCLNASNTLHNRMLSTMTKGVMRFFDTNTSGRILNRFTKDMTTLDESLPRTLLFLLQIFGLLTGVLVLNAIALYWTIFPSIILLFFIVVVTKIYLKTAQSVKRMEATTKSPLLNMVKSTFDGITTIRAAGAQERLINEFDKLQNLHTAAWNTQICGERSLAFYLDTLCLVYLSMIIFVFINYDFEDMIPVGSVGMAVSQCNSLTGMMQYGARMVVDFIAQLTSVERVLEYTRIDTEENLFEGKTPLNNSTWPSKGVIVFDNVNMRYAPDETPVLTNVNFEIKSGWKVGVVGRTGAGKSSLISALFRFTLIDGKITIDGLDTALVAKQELRSMISIIPQEPVLFSATIRYNLDPNTVYSDADLWKALEQVHMKSAVPSLDFKVMEGGANFSVGQRQLLCLARAALRSNKILIMDEATANVDPQTDDFIQNTIREHFASCTVLTIAHRLNTVMDSDRVLVMSAGQVAEFDHPYILLSDPNSHLTSMVKETGEKSAAQLLQVAKNTYSQSNVEQDAR